MCRMCDDPNLTPADLRADTVAAIERYGWQVQYVEAGEGQPALAYTVGLTGRDLPEVCVLGLPVALAHPLLNHVVGRCLEEGLRAGNRLEAPDGKHYRLVPYRGVEPLYTALDIYGSRVRALQLRPSR